MARINKSDPIQKAVNDLALSPSDDKIPTETLDKVQLVYSLNKQFSSFVVSNSSGGSGTLTLTMPTIDGRSEIFLTGIDLGIIKDASCDVATSVLGVSVTPAEGGIAKAIIDVPVITLTAQDEHVNIQLPYPLKLKANTNITIGGTFTLGVMQRSLTATGFTTSTN